jgi:hypothetical protein
MPSLTADYAGFRAECDRLTNLLRSTGPLDPAHRKFIAEIALLRLAILIESSMYIACCKLACGASYLDGTLPNLLVQQRNIPAAVASMQTLNRVKFHQLRWNEGARIRTNIEHVIHARDPIVSHLRNYAWLLTEIRYVRNHIAHRNEGTRTNYVKVIRKYYGASVRGITCGNLLVSPRVSTPPLLEGHIARTRVMLKDVFRA